MKKLINIILKPLAVNVDIEQLKIRLRISYAGYVILDRTWQIPTTPSTIYFLKKGKEEQTNEIPF